MILYIIYFLLSPILWILTHIASLFHSKIKIRKKNYSGLLNIALEKVNNTNKKVILFHAASNGELEQIRPIFRQINKEDYFIMLTISSPSSYNHIPTNEIDTFCYQSFDFPWSVYNFFKKVKPHKYIITRHDIWPNHIVLSKIFCDNLYLINANLPKFSKRLYPLVITLYSYIFSFFTQIYTVSKEISGRFEKIIDPNKIKIFGDTRIDQIKYRFKNNNSLTPIYNDSKNILFGSIDEYDIPIIFESLQNIYEEINCPKLIFVPHEPDNKMIAIIERKLMELSISSIRFSSMDKTIDENKFGAVIIDKVGILAESYKFSTISYIGCGFSKGVHNVVEPAIYENIICFGPNYEILNEAIELVQRKLAYPINNSTELSSILKLISDDKKIDEYRVKLNKYLFDQSKFSKKIIGEIF